MHATSSYLKQIDVHLISYSNFVNIDWINLIIYSWVSYVDLLFNLSYWRCNFYGCWHHAKLVLVNVSQFQNEDMMELAKIFHRIENTKENPIDRIN